MAVQYAFGKIITQGLDLNVDAADPTSYPGSGTSWTNVVNRSITGSLISCSFSSDFKGGIVFNNPSASVVFPGTVANYGTGSFTVEMAFRPTQISGIHYLVSKNSGSFPNWGVYLSGSGGSGKLFAEYRISSTVSCSISSSTTFVTGSVYQADIILAPGASGSGITLNGISDGSILGNGGGSLTTTSSLFVGSYSTNTTQNFSGSIYLLRAYSTVGFTLPVVNYNTISTRFSKPPIPETAKKIFELLVVAGGGGSVTSLGGGGGAGGLQYFSSITPSLGRTAVVVGDGGTAGGGRGQNSSFGSIISFGGGGSAGGNNGSNAINANGGSGGGAGFGNGVPGTGSIGQGTSGGTGTGGTTAAGGGGASQSGRAHNDLTSPGAGGSGSFISSFAAIGGFPAGWFAGGGGGGTGAGGIGGGGIGGNTPGTPGVTNTGGGAGGPAGAGAQGAKGGSGIVAIRYNGTPIALGGEITQSEGYTYHVFRQTGSATFTIF